MVNPASEWRLLMRLFVCWAAVYTHYWFVSEIWYSHTLLLIFFYYKDRKKEGGKQKWGRLAWSSISSVSPHLELLIFMDFLSKYYAALERSSASGGWPGLNRADWQRSRADSQRNPSFFTALDFQRKKEREKERVPLNEFCFFSHIRFLELKPEQRESDTEAPPASATQQSGAERRRREKRL